MEQDVDVMFRRLQIDSSNNLSMQILIILSPCTLFNLIYGFVSNIARRGWPLGSDLSVIKWENEGNIFQVFINLLMNNDSQKINELKISFFSWRSTINLLSGKSDWIPGNFFTVSKVFNKFQ